MKNNRSHAIRSELAFCAMGQAISGDDLDALSALAPEGIRTDFREKVAAASERIVALKESGQFGLARTEAAAAAVELMDFLEPPVDQSATDPLDSLRPRELARAVTEGGADAKQLREDVARIPRL